MKKFFTFLLICTMTLGIMGCGKDTPTPPEETVHAVPATMETMSAPIDALARCMTENHITYDARDPEFFWTALFYFTGSYGVYHELIETTEDYRLKVPYMAMQEHATVLFGDYSDLLPMPAGMDEYITYDPDWDAYFVSAGDIGLSEMRLTSYEETMNGYEVTAELWSVGPEEELISAYTVIMMDNPYIDDITNPLYLYSITSMKEITADGSDSSDSSDSSEPSVAPEETATAIFNGLSDSHTVEVTMPDGSVQPFQFDANSDAGNKIADLKAGDGFTFGYITDTSTGAAKIILVK